MSKAKRIPFIDPSLAELWSLQPAWSPLIGGGFNLISESHQAEPASGVASTRTYVVSLEQAPLPNNLPATVRALLGDVSPDYCARYQESAVLNKIERCR